MLANNSILVAIVDCLSRHSQRFAFPPQLFRVYCMSLHCCSIFPCQFPCDWMFRYGRVLYLLTACTVLFAGTSVAADEPKVADDSEWTVRVNAGGIGRYVTDRWGMTKAVASNSGTTTQSGLVVVTPPGSVGLQYAKTITVPAGASFETSWPVRLGTVNNKLSEFAYLAFPGGIEDGLIHRKTHDEYLPNYSGMVDLNRAS